MHSVRVWIKGVERKKKRGQEGEVRLILGVRTCNTY